jgi:hypothetical protein
MRINKNLLHCAVADAAASGKKVQFTLEVSMPVLSGVGLC